MMWPRDDLIPENSSPVTSSGQTGQPETNETSSTGLTETGQNNPDRFLILGLAIFIVLSFFLLFFFLLRKNHTPRTTDPRRKREVERDLAGMALHALLHPNQGAWGPGSGIRDLPIIPVLNGNAVSIRKALKPGHGTEIIYRHQRESAYGVS